MLAYDAMIEKLQVSLSKKRFLHTLEVMNVAAALADHYQEDIEKAKIAGLLHDCAKEYSDSLRTQLCKELHVPIDSVMQQSPHLIHSFLGAEIAKLEYKVEDEYILNAIRYHTTGRAKMTLLEKIIFLADYIEPTRVPFEGLDTVRRLAYLQIDQALYKALDLTIHYVKSKKGILHPFTVQAKEDLEQIVK